MNEKGDEPRDRCPRRNASILLVAGAVMLSLGLYAFIADQSS